MSGITRHKFVAGDGNFTCIKGRGKFDCSLDTSSRQVLAPILDLDTGLAVVAAGLKLAGEGGVMTCWRPADMGKCCTQSSRNENGEFISEMHFTSKVKF
jgi:hypothetical protein